jgi:chemotaxis protein MotA
MNISVLIGLLLSFGGLITGFLMEKGVIASLFLPSPFIIVFGGTMGAVIFSFGIGDCISALKAFAACFLGKNKPNPDALINKMVKVAEKCRAEGLLTLQNMVNDPDIKGDQYLLLKEGMLLLMDMKDVDHVQSVLESDIEAFTAKRQAEIEVFAGAGGFSPTLGIIGTVMGLVQVLSNMEDAEQLTASIAVAFIATLYGVVFANLIYLPIANILKADLKRQKLFKQLIIDGILLIASGDNPRDLENKLSLYYQAFPKGEKKYKKGITGS